MQQEDYKISERRKYIRLDTVLPVGFHLLSLDGRSFLSERLQGFTNNIGKGGLCLLVNNLPLDLAQILKSNQANVSLEIEIPIIKSPVIAQAKVIWIKELNTKANKYLIGLSYEQIDLKKNNRIMRYVWMKKLFVPLALSIIIILGLGIAINSVINIKLIQGNKALVGQLVKILQESSIAKQKIKQLSKERETLQLEIHAMELRIRALNEEKTTKEKANDARIKELNTLLDKLTQEKGALQAKLIAIQDKENKVTEELLHLDKKKSYLEKANFDKMYQWLKVHQNPGTGLVLSFEGAGNVQNWAFTYDQALVLQAYTYFADFPRAKKILEFYQKKAKRQEGSFLNAYYVKDGSPAEYMVHTGPNIWLGMSIVQYTKKTKDTSYLELAQDIAKQVISLQNKDVEGGIRGGWGLDWYSTEHNLDAYAFFNMLYKVTGKGEYLKAGDKTLAWLLKHTYDKPDIPVKRGKGDATIATDTYAWSIAAIGPEKLEALGMNPDKILEFAEESCGVETDFIRPEGQTIRVRGFDFASQMHIARGGVVSCEWTAQMILAFKLMANFYDKKGLPAKANLYTLKADTYLAELANMIICSPSPSGQGESCLPYASQDYVDTGHGWITPKGKWAGSVSGTTYALFAYYNYNPLELKE